MVSFNVCKRLFEFFLRISELSAYLNASINELGVTLVHQTSTKIKYIREVNILETS